MIIFFLKNIEIITNWIDLSPSMTCVMHYIKFNNFFTNYFFFNYMIKIYAHKIEHQYKNRHLFEIVITL
jgi:hypothetical protein